MFCTQCGKEINEGVRFCENCGAAVEVKINTAEKSNKQNSNNQKSSYIKEIAKGIFNFFDSLYSGYTKVVWAFLIIILILSIFKII